MKVIFFAQLKQMKICPEREVQKFYKCTKSQLDTVQPKQEVHVHIKAN